MESEAGRTPSTEDGPSLAPQLAGLTKLGPFAIVRPLGAGGFAPVLLAREVYGGVDLREVALKVFVVPASRGEERRRAIVAEARALCRVEHPNVVRFLQLAEDGDVLGLAMELVIGTSLVDRMEQLGGTLPEDEVLEAGVAIASALSAVHRAGLVHRDVKPSNVVATGGTYKLIDFGIATGGRAGASLPPRPAAGLPSSVRVAAPPPARGDEAFDRTIAAVTPGPAADATTPSIRSVIPEPTSSSGAPQETTDTGDNLAGTFGFVDPECMGRNAPPTAASDLYALGALLYQALSGALPAEGESGRLNHLILTGVLPAPALRERAPHVTPELAALVDALVSPTRAKRPQSAEVVVSELERMRRLRAGLDVPVPAEEEGPFRGLDRFEARHRSVYFGRSAEVAAALDLLRVRGLLCLAGASGSGKSSLGRAAVVPAIETGALGGWPRAWDSLVVTPSHTADLRGWLLATAGVELPPGSDADAVLAAFGRRAEASGRGLVVLLDQMEELFTAPRSDTADVLELLARSAERPVPGLRFVTTVRRDFFDPLLADPRFSRVLGRSVLVVHPLSTAAWLEVLDQALGRYGYGFESPAMRETLAAELRTMSDAMPLVQFALAKLWAERDRSRRVLTTAALARAGGLAGALDQHAEAVVSGLVATQGPEALEAVRAVTAALTTAQGTRATTTPARVLESTRHPLARPALDALVAARLVTIEGGAASLTHDVLVQAWERLRRWTAQAQKERELAEELERQAAAWKKRPVPELLWRGTQLAEARALTARRSVPLGDDALAFVAASRRLSLRGRIAGGVLVASVCCAGLLGWSLYVDVRHRQEKSADNVSTLLDRAAQRADRTNDLTSRLRATRDELAACRAACSASPAPAPASSASAKPQTRNASAP